MKKLIEISDFSATESGNIRESIESLIIDNEGFNRIEKEFGQFCLFEALGVVRAEVRHGTFLAYLLDPYRPHGFGSKILRALLLTAAQSARSIGITSTDLAPISIHLLNLDDADVHREWKNIDLLVVLNSEKIVIAVELKIDSSQSLDQLARYRSTIQSNWSDGWRHLFIFLTKHDEEPNDIEFWIPVRLRQLAPKLGEIITSSETSPAASGMLDSYLIMLKRHHMIDEALENIAQKLWREHSEALTFLADRRPDAIADVISILTEEKQDIAKDISSDVSQVVVDGDNSSLVRFAVKAWDVLPGFQTAKWTDSKRLILIEIKREGTKIVGLVYLGPGTTEDREIYLKKVKDQRLHKQNSRAGKDWTCLAKIQLYNANADEIDSKLVAGKIRADFKNFGLKVISHFNPLLLT